MSGMSVTYRTYHGSRLLARSHISPIIFRTTIVSSVPRSEKTYYRSTIHSAAHLKPTMATNWKLQELSQTLQKGSKPQSSPSSFKPPTQTINNYNAKPTPFDKPLPPRTSVKFLRHAKSHPGTYYAVYALVSLSHDRMTALLAALAESHADEDWSSSFTPAPTYDFSTPNKNSVRDIYDYHTSLLETLSSNPHDLHADKFLVIAHANWEDNGVLLVELDCHTQKPGTIGMMRLPVGMAGPTVMLMESGPDNFKPVKEMERYGIVKEGIEGYTGTKWEEVDEWWDEPEDEGGVQRGQAGVVREAPRKVTMLSMTGNRCFPS